MPKTGFLDSIDGRLLRGWAHEEGADSPATVEICLNGVVVASVLCADFRPDLAAAHIGDGRHGFSYGFPPEYGPLFGIVTVRFAGSGPVLTNGERVVPDLGSRLLSSSVLAKGLWSLKRLELSDTGIALEGWAIPPRALALPVAITHNQAALQLTRHRRDDIAGKLGLSQDEVGFGFTAQAHAGPEVRSHEFRFEHAATRRPFDPHQTIHYILSDKPLPPERLRVRVHGSADPVSFIREGSSTFARIQHVLQCYFSKSIADSSHVLDWGCGSGRVLRYLDDGIQSTGIDIDQEAIEWCRQAFPRFQFLTVPTVPPTSIPDNTFDLIYGISVLTHLSEADHLRWLAELHRISQPNAILLLTTFGDTACWRSRLPFSMFPTLAGGFSDGGRNSDLDQVDVNREYYRNVFIAHEYILQTWSRYFEVVDILPGAIGNLQDLVILRR